MRALSLIGATIGVLAAASASSFNPTSADINQVTQERQEKPFLVEVVADGVPPDGKLYSPTQDQRSQLPGLDLWIGASTAYLELKNNQSDHDLAFQLKPNDDQDLDKSAIDIAQTIQAEPRALAIIGHGITSTTRAAAPLYSQSGIPLIVALATADDALKDTNRVARLAIAHRLSPSDGEVQAPAIAYFVGAFLEQTPKGDVHLYESNADGAAEYSAPLCRETSTILKANKYRTELSSLDSVSAAVNEIETNHDDSDFIVYCGYSNEAAKLIDQLDAEYSSNSKLHHPPQIVMSDAVSQDVGKDAKKLNLFRMTALDLDHCTDAKALNRIAGIARTVGRPLTAEQVRGYDAVMVLDAAANACAGHLSRKCIRDQLDSGMTFPGACSDYSFRKGENFISDYYVFPEAMASGNQLQPAPGDSRSEAITLTAPEVMHMLMVTESAPKVK